MKKVEACNLDYSTKEIQMTVYVHPDHVQFIHDMEMAGLETFHHQGPFSWQGPAVLVSDPTDVLSQTQVLCQWQLNWKDVPDDEAKPEDSWIFFGQRNDLHEKCKANRQFVWDHHGYVIYPLQGMEVV